MGDFNEEVRSKLISGVFTILNMKEAIIAKYGKKALNIFYHGANPIDGIFVSNELCVRNCGYTPSKWGMQTDHRFLWIEIAEEHLFGTTTHPIWKPRARRLKTDDPQVVQRFLKERLKLMEKDNLTKRLNILYTQIKDISLTAAQEIEMEQLDHLRTEHIIRAEKLGRKLKMGGVPWSPVLQLSINRIRYFRACISRYQHHKVNSRTLITLFEAANLSQKISTLVGAKNAIASEYKTYNEIKLSSSVQSNQYLHELAERKAKNGNQKVASVLKQLVRRETQQDQSRKLK
jgi:hypothetical protein